MTEILWTSLVPKMLLGAAVVVLVALIVERAGTLIGALIMTLPVTAGPAYVFLAMEHGPSFLQDSAAAGLLGTAANGIFIIAYVILAQRLNLLGSLGISLVFWLAAAWVIVHTGLRLSTRIALNLAIFVTGIAFVWHMLSRQSLTPSTPRWWALSIRAVLVMLLIALVLVIGRKLGPTGAGLAAVAPVVLISLICILHPRVGGRATADVMIQGLWGMIGFVLALATLSIASVPLGSAAALSLALLMSLGWNAAALAFKRLW